MTFAEISEDSIRAWNLLSGIFIFGIYCWFDDIFSDAGLPPKYKDKNMRVKGRASMIRSEAILLKPESSDNRRTGL